MTKTERSPTISLEFPRGRDAVLLIAMLVFVRLLILVAGLDALPPDHAGSGLGNDATRFHEIAREKGTPYRDFELEVAPVSLAAIYLLAGETSRDTAFRLGGSQLILDLVAALLLGIGWGRAAGLGYLLLGTPITFFLYFRLDLLSVVLAVLGVLLVRRGRERVGGLALAAAILTKFWPIALVVLLGAQRRWRTTAWAIGGLALGTLAWVWWGGWRGPLQVLSLRNAEGWEIESLPGSILWAMFRFPVREESGALRLGLVPAWVQVLLPVCALALTVFIGVRSRRKRMALEAVPALGAVSVLMLFSTVLSHQYISWLLPWAALAERRSLQVLTFIAGLCATGVIISGSISGAGATWLHLILLFARNALLIGVAVISLRLVGAGRGVGSRGSPSILTGEACSR